MSLSSAGRRMRRSRCTSSWGARVVQRQRDDRPSARQLELSLLAALGLTGCLLDPLKIGPGDELSDDASSSLDDASLESSGSTDEAESSESSSSDTDTSETDASDTDTSETDTSDTGEPTCGPQGALPEGACETLLGYYWDGATCLALHGCGCNPECPPLFATAVECWQAYLSCGPSPCAGRDEAGCMADTLCSPRYARPLALDIDTTCVAAPIYAGCGLAIPCANAITYACSVQQPDAVHQFADPCLPEWDWFPCDPPAPDPIPDCP